MKRKIMRMAKDRKGELMRKKIRILKMIVKKVLKIEMELNKSRELMRRISRTE
jgi:hypothetical protein